MKIRASFVSNSSTSSFVCCICGREESGMDLSLSDCEMVECENGHIVCESELVEEIPDKIKESDDFDSYSIPEKYCPVCNFLAISERDVAKYLEKETNISRKEVFEEVKKSNKRRQKLYDSEYLMYVCAKSNIDRNTILPKLKERFGNYSEFLKYLN